MIIMVAAVIALVAGLAYVKYSQIKAGMAEGAKHAPPPPAVTTMVAKGQNWQPVLSAIGSLRAINGVDVSTDLAGIVTEIAFESGKPVKQGDLLVKLDTQQEEAQLKSAEAARDLAKLNLARQHDLLVKKAASQSDFDSATSTANQTEAAVDQVKALIARKTIHAPFTGVLGIRQVNIGQYLDVGKPIVTLQSQNPINVEFSLPQQYLDQIALGKKIHLKAAGITGKEFDGTITAINSKVDETTRNIQVEGTVANPDNQLRAGMFVDVKVLLPEKSGVLAIPSSAISYAPYGDSIFIVTDAKSPDGKPIKQVINQIVTLGPTRGDQVSIVKGLKEGDELVTSGVFKLHSNSPVTINNDVPPGNDANPNPPDT